MTKNEDYKKLLAIVAKTLNHFYPDFFSWLKKAYDPRDQRKIKYPIKDIIISGILIFLLRLGSRRQFHYKLDSEVCENNLKILFGMNGRPHGDTLRCFERMKIDDIEGIKYNMIKTMICKKILNKYKLLNKYYLVACDGTGVLVYHKKHCEHCLEKTHKETTTYYHPVLECKIVTKNKMAFSIYTEHIENPEGWDKDENRKQDCELKAFYRSAEKIKKLYPKLPICQTLDAIFANTTVFNICKKNNWSYIIALKNNLKSVNEELDLQIEHNLANVKEISTDEGNKQIYQWVNNIIYRNSDNTNASSHLINAVEMKEIDSDGNILHFFRFITNIEITFDNVEELVNVGGRSRWKIENEGFNTQKNGGYELEHAYSQNYNASKIFYQLLQIACIISRLIELGNLIKKSFPNLFGSYKNISAKILDSINYIKLSYYYIKKQLSTRFQIRFDTS